VIQVGHKIPSFSGLTKEEALAAPASPGVLGTALMRVARSPQVEIVQNRTAADPLQGLDCPSCGRLTADCPGEGRLSDLSPLSSRGGFLVVTADWTTLEASRIDGERVLPPREMALRE